MRLALRVAILIVLSALALVSAPARADAAPPRGEPAIYVVQPGDTLFAIAARYQTTVAAIKQLNHLNSDTIQVGQKLLVPIDDTRATLALPAPRSSAHIVQPGDTLYRLALRYGTTPRAIMQLNGISSPDLIAPGQSLAIPNHPTLKPGLIIEPTTARQGSTLVIRVAHPDLASVAGAFNGRPLRFTRAGGYAYALVPISRCAKIGAVPLTLTTTDTTGQSVTEGTTISVTSTAFSVQNIALPPSVSAILNNQSLVRREAQELAAIVSRYTPTRLWNGAWRLPVYGAITSAFGTRRSYNGGAVGACGHEGTDFGMETGDPVYAPARGRIVFADTTQVRGKLVVIDHGIGVLSGYYHLSEINTQVGQIVDVGAIIGRVGSTGLSTGSHLHWSVWVNGEYVDPLEWTRRLIP